MPPVTITIEQILKRVEPVKPVSRRQLFRYLNKAGVKPLGKVQTKPSLYPGNAAERVLDYLGLGTRIVSMPTLRAARDKAQRARGR